MKKIVIIALVLTLALSLAACGGNSGGGSTTTPPANSSTTTPPSSSTPDASQGADNSGSQGAQQPAGNGGAAGTDQFARHGINGIVPDDAEEIICVNESATLGAATLTEYSFKVSATNRDEETKAYFNKVLDVVRAASDDGKAYHLNSNYNASTQQIESEWVEWLPGDSLDGLDGIFMLTVFYYYNGDLLQLMVSDDGPDDYHLYVPLLTLAREPELP